MRIVAAVLFFCSFVGFAVVAAEIVNFFEYHDGAEVDGEVSAHIMGPSIAWKPGEYYTSILVNYDDSQARSQELVVHGFTDPPPVGETIKLLEHPDDPSDAVWKQDGLGRLIGSHTLVPLTIALVLAVLGIWSWFGGGAGASPVFRYGPGLLLALGLAVLGIFLVVATVFDQRRQSEDYVATQGEVVGHQECGESEEFDLWCLQIRYRVGDEDYELRGPRTIQRPAEPVGAKVTVRYEPNRPGLAVIERGSGSLFPVFLGGVFALGGGFVFVFGLLRIFKD